MLSSRRSFMTRILFLQVFDRVGFNFPTFLSAFETGLDMIAYVSRLPPVRR